MKITLNGFSGENRAGHPLLIGDTQGTVSINQNPVRGDLRPWKALVNVATVPAGRKTIYRMGRDVASDTLYWLSWPTVVDTVRGLIANDTTERTYYTGDGVPKWTDNTKALATQPYPTAFRILGVPAPVTAPTLAAAGGTSDKIKTRFYVYTYVNENGDESMNSPVSESINCKQDDTVTLTGIAPPPAGEYFINRVRIYRTQLGSDTGTDFFLLREIAAGVTTTTDTGQKLGETLPSKNWETPPANLSNLTGMWNGMMAGISGNAVRFCVPFQPYAWPSEYEIIPSDSRPVALATFGQAMLVLTTGKPVLVTGGGPEAIDDQPLQIAEACVSVRSVVSLGHGVVWASPDGLAYYGVGGNKMLTAGLMTRDDWQAIKPDTIVGAMYEGAYMGFYTVGGVTKGFVIDTMRPTGIFFTDIAADAVFFDELQDQLYVLNGVNISKWNSGAALITRFRSKTFRSPKPINVACAEVVAENYPVQFTLFGGGVQRFVLSVLDAEPFRLPSGYMAQDWQVEVSTSGAVQSVSVAQSIQELSQV